MTGDRVARTVWLLAILLLGVPLLVRFAFLVSASPPDVRRVIQFIFDDGYYYLGIAANVARTGHSTLDGVTATNGYQPGWLLVLSGFAWLVGTRPWTLFVASCTLIYCIALASPLLAVAWFKTHWRRAVLAFAAALSIITIQQPEPFLEGLEPVLLLPLALPLILLLESAREPRQLRQLSLLLALCFLVRLDALALFAATALVLTLAGSPTRAVPAVLARGFAVTLQLSVYVLPTVLLYLAINHWLFDSAVPVSGIAKMIGGPKFSNWGIAADFFSRWKSFLFLLVLLAPLELLGGARARADRLFYRSFYVVSLAAAAQCIYYCTLSTWGVWPWYSYLVALDMAIVVARILYVSAMFWDGAAPDSARPDSAQHGSAPMRYAALVVIAFLGVWGLYRAGLFVVRSMPEEQRSRVPVLGKIVTGGTTLQNRAIPFNTASIDMLDEFFATLPRTVVAMGDRAGGLAYWGADKISLVQTEGLTLDIGYLRARVENRGAEYLETRFPIQFLIVDREFIPTVPAPGGGQLLVIPDPIQGRVTVAPVPTFCFPESAVRYRKVYPGQFGLNTRLAFAFADRVSCPPEALALVSSAARTVGLRKFSLPSEY